MALKLIAQGVSACRTFVTGHSFLFVDDSLAGDSRGSRIAWYHDDCCWQTADGTLLTRLDCSGPLLVLLFNGSEGTVAYPCRHCHG